MLRVMTSSTYHSFRTAAFPNVHVEFVSPCLTTKFFSLSRPRAVKASLSGAHFGPRHWWPVDAALAKATSAPTIN
jgi:hypothetical protein